MAEIKLCDQTDCKQPAALQYRWDWGTTGVCCQEHGLLLQQTAHNLSSHDLKRNISLTSLESAPEAPLERSERTALIAGKLSAEAEADEIRKRSGELYQANVALTGDVQRLTLRLREADAQLVHVRKQMDQLDAKLKQREIDLGTVTDELQRMQTLAAFAPEPANKGKTGKGEATKGG